MNDKETLFIYSFEHNTESFLCEKHIICDISPVFRCPGVSNREMRFSGRKRRRLAPGTGPPGRNLCRFGLQKERGEPPRVKSIAILFLIFEFCNTI